MDANIGAVAAEFGKAIVQAMASDAWGSVRPLIAEVFSRAGEARLVGALDSDRRAVHGRLMSEDRVAGMWHVRVEALLSKHPELSSELIALVDDVRRSAAGEHSATYQAVTGNRGFTQTAGRDIVGPTRKNINFGGIMIVVAVLAVVAILGGRALVNNINIPGVDSAKIGAETPCSEYLRASQSEREQAVQRIAVEQKVSGAGSPFLVLNVDTQCGRLLDSPVGDIVAKQQY